MLVDRMFQNDRRLVMLG